MLELSKEIWGEVNETILTVLSCIKRKHSFIHPEPTTPYCTADLELDFCDTHLPWAPALSQGYTAFVSILKTLYERFLFDCFSFLLFFSFYWLKHILHKVTQIIKCGVPCISTNQIIHISNNQIRKQNTTHTVVYFFFPIPVVIILHLLDGAGP